jgi:hypothetical protein
MKVLLQLWSPAVVAWFSTQQKSPFLIAWLFLGPILRRPLSSALRPARGEVPRCAHERVLRSDRIRTIGR